MRPFPDATGQRRRAGRVAVLVGSVAALAATALFPLDASGSSTPTPPSWLDLVSQMGQIANSQSGTEAALLTVDAAIRNGLNGTTAGYVYDLASDVAQLSLDLRDLIRNSVQLTKQVTAANAMSQVAITAWNKEYTAYRKWYADIQMPGACSSSTSPCAREGKTVEMTWTTALSSASTGAYREYGLAISTLDEVATDATEVLLGARAITGDAKDYPGNKEFEAAVQVIGEHRVATFIGKLVTKATGVRSALQAQETRMGRANSTGRVMAGLVGVGYPGKPPPPL